MKLDDAVREKVHAAEKDVAAVRLAVVVLNTFVYLLLQDRADTTTWLAVPTLTLAISYSLFVLVARPYRRFPILMSGSFTSLTDALLIVVWLQATGGFNSPFYPVWYISIAALAYRWNARNTMIGAAVYSMSYLALVGANGQLGGHAADMTARIGYIFLVGALGSLLSGEVIDQIRAKLELRKVATHAAEAEAKFRRLSEVTLEGVVIHDDGIIVDLNRALADMFGYEESEMTGRNVRDFLLNPPEDEPAATLPPDGGKPRQYNAVRKDGSIFSIEVLARDYVYEGREVRVAAVRDVMDRIKAENSLRERESRFRALIENASDFIIVLDGAGTIRYVSPSVSRMTGYQEGELVGASSFKFAHPDDIPSLVEIFERRLVERGVGVPIEFRIKRADGEWRTLEAIGNFEMVDSPELGGIILNARDITERRQAEEEVKQLAYHDSLTGLPNRALFEERLNEALDYARSRGEMLSVVFLDIDHFKLVNDSLGHIGGDELLRIVGDELSQLIREEDTVARVGGDEFVILLTGISNQLETVEVAQRILSRFDKRRVIRGRELRMTTSIGISIFPGHGDEPDTLLANADIAMYQAKDRGRNGYQVYSPAMKEYVLERLALENDLRNALDHHEFVVYYQPIVEIESGEIVAAEALIRWQHPERGLVAPDGFIPFASESGLVAALDEWVLRTSCATAAKFHGAGHDLRMAVNFSARTLQRGDLVDLVARTLGETGLSPDKLVVEITEGSVLSNMDAIANSLRQLREVGVRVSVDDFGTGYSSLNYIKRLPIDAVKVDRSFIRDVTTDPSDAAIVSTIISMGHSLGLRVIAEGVEEDEQLEFLRERGCDEFQGFFFARPVPADDLEELMENNRNSADTTALEV